MELLSRRGHRRVNSAVIPSLVAIEQAAEVVLNRMRYSRLLALMAADKVLERAWGKSKEAPDSPSDDVARGERAAEARRKLFDMLNALAVPETLNEAEAERE